jgi:hypothetical protein
MNARLRGGNSGDSLVDGAYHSLRALTSRGHGHRAPFLNEEAWNRYSARSFSTFPCRSLRALVSRKFPFLSTSHMVGMLWMQY